MDVRDRVISALAISHPVLFVVAGIIERFNGHAGVVEDVVRPMVVGVLVAVLLTVIFWAILRTIEWAAMTVSVLVLLNLEYALPGLLLTVLAVWWMLISSLRRLRAGAKQPTSSPNPPARAAGLYAVALLVVVGGSVAIAPRPDDAFPDMVAPQETGGPDIFLFVLDGYPRTDTLRTEFGFDNGGFEADLDRMGFRVAPDAEANYNKTWLTMASMLSGSYVHEHLDPTVPVGGLGDQSRRLHGVINDAPVLDYLRQRGYRIISIPSQVRTTDVTIDVEVRSPPGLSTLEVSLVSRSLIGRLLPEFTADLLIEDVRNYITAQMRLVETEVTPQETPRLVLTHFLTPHPPFVLGQEADYLHRCFPVCGIWSTTVDDTGLSEEEYAARMAAQVDALNDMMTDALREIVDANPDAVVIVLSDHGARHQLDAFDEHFRAFFAARTPEQPATYGGEISPVNVFRRFLSAYFGEVAPDVPHMTWLSDWESPLTLERFESSER